MHFSRMRTAPVGRLPLVRWEGGGGGSDPGCTGPCRTPPRHTPTAQVYAGIHPPGGQNDRQV